jgi:hypothetical protein
LEVCVSFRDWYGPEWTKTVEKMVPDPNSEFGDYTPSGQTFEMAIIPLSAREQMPAQRGAATTERFLKGYADASEIPGGLNHYHRLSVPGYGETDVVNIVPCGFESGTLQVDLREMRSED